MLNRLKGILFEFEQKISTQFNKISKKKMCGDWNHFWDSDGIFDMEKIKNRHITKRISR